MITTDIPGPQENSDNGLDDDCEPFTHDSLIPTGEECVRNIPGNCGDYFCLEEEITDVDCFQAIDSFTFGLDSNFTYNFNGESDPNYARSLLVSVVKKALTTFKRLTVKQLKPHTGL